MLAPLTPPPGLNQDDSSFSRPGVWRDGSNVRFEKGMPEVIGGWSDALNGSTLTGVCRNAFAWRNNGGLINIAFGTHSRLQVYQGSVLASITPSGLIEGSVDTSGTEPGWGTGTWGSGTWGDPQSTYYARTWSFSTYGEKLIANPRGGTIYEWDGDTAVLATAVSNAPSVVTCALVTAERQLLAFGCNEESSGNFNSRCIRGSNIEDITDWTTGPTDNAFEHILEGGGNIITARIVGAFVVVWTDQGVHLGQFIGDPGQAYRFDLIADQCGVIGPNAVTVLGETALWVGRDGQFWVWSIGGVPQPLMCPIQKDFVDNFVSAQKEKICAVTLAEFGEVWFFYPDSRDGTENSRYLVYCVEESRNAQMPVWFHGTLERTGTIDTGANSYPIWADSSGNAFYHEYGTTANGSSLSWSIQTSDQYLNEDRRSMMLRSFVPDFQNQDGDVTLTLYVRDYPMSAATTKGPYTIATSDVKKDLRASGRIVAAKFSGTAATRIGKPAFDTVPTGAR